MTDHFIAPERAECADAIETLHAEAFGPGRFTRAAFRLREQGPHDPALSFVALSPGGDLLGSVRMTPVVTAESGRHGHLLGPLAVAPKHKNQGFGRALVRHAVEAASVTPDSGFVLLVGDAPYYAPLGFCQVPAGRLLLPGPVDPRRLLVHPLGDDAIVKALAGIVGYDHRPAVRATLGCAG
ncbi:MAG: N-acetyltransferase [Roseitalea sp.]|jgi:predicted N-acetyltransferase YhbS|nr:N-acetyltransferase [Roseitalea sp.]MBO6723224.1 N-acetyltransferase [Roseitalea sp.]MBO6741794.1 N-acetyltransferase [Roseitalea sp.]